MLEGFKTPAVKTNIPSSSSSGPFQSACHLTKRWLRTSPATLLSATDDIRERCKIRTSAGTPATLGAE